MTASRSPTEEFRRLNELYSHELLDTSSESEFDDIVKLASQLCESSISLISLIDQDRQWFKAKIGLDLQETKREYSICSHVILNDGFFTVHDASKDERFQTNPLVTGDPNIRFYAGFPLTTKKGYKLGTLCVIDPSPKTLHDGQLFALSVLANSVMKLIDERMQKKQLRFAHTVQQRVTSMLAHDIRNPLSSLKAILELQSSEDITPEEVQQLTKTLPGRLDELLSIVNEFVEWGRANIKEGYNKDESSEPYELKELLKEAINSQIIAASSKGLAIDNSVDDHLILSLNKRKLSFIIRNIVGNSIKFTEKGYVKIDGYKKGELVIILITDTGIGMNEKIVLSLFDPEKSSSRFGTNNEKGTGLGLLLVKEYINDLYGTIDVKSIENRGTSIRLSFCL